VQDVARAQSRAREERIDAALVDANLAGSTVEEVAATLARRGVPFAFVTGYGREALPKAFREAILVEKPFTQEQVIAALERLLARPSNVSQLRPNKKPS
jgi:DNA-binding response OmpR family regulator